MSIIENNHIYELLVKQTEKIDKLNEKINKLELSTNTITNSNNNINIDNSTKIIAYGNTNNRRQNI